MTSLRSTPNFTHLILRVPLVCLCTSMPDFSVFGSERVEAYWGSFGERSGRIEGAFLKTANAGIFIGFDLAGEGVTHALVRSVGPGLAYFDVSECTENPNLPVYQHGLKSWKNDDWAIAENFEKSSVTGNRLGAFP